MSRVEPCALRRTADLGRRAVELQSAALVLPPSFRPATEGTTAASPGPDGVLHRHAALDLPNHLPNRLPHSRPKNENPPFPAGSEVELVGLEPTTSWVRSS